MFIRDTYSLLAEAAAMDLETNTSSALTESQIDSIMESIEEVSEDIVYTAEMVSVIKVGDDYLTEMNALYPYMTSNGITSVAEALNNVARVNGLQEKAVGLLIESDKQIKDMINKAAEKGSKAKEKALDKVKKATKLPEKLKKQGFPVKKKKCKNNNEGCVKEGCGNKKSVKENNENCTTNKCKNNNEGCVKDVKENKADIAYANELRHASDKLSGSHNPKAKAAKKQIDDAVRGNGSIQQHNSNEYKKYSDMSARGAKDVHNSIRNRDNEREKRKKQAQQESTDIFDFDLL